MRPDDGAVTIGWRAPTSTGGKTLVGFKVMLRHAGAWKEVAQVPPAGPGAQCEYDVTGLAVGEEYGFRVVTAVEGAAGVESKVLDKSADGKHPLALLAAKADKADAADSDDEGAATACEGGHYRV